MQMIEHIPRLSLCIGNETLQNKFEHKIMAAPLWDEMMALMKSARALEI